MDQIPLITKVKSYIPDDKDLSEIPQFQKRPVAKPLTHYKNKNKDRDKPVIKAFESGGYSMKKIGDHFDLHFSTVSRIVR